MKTFILLFVLITGVSSAYAAPSFIGHALMRGNKLASRGQGLGLLKQMSPNDIKASPLRFCSGACLKMWLGGPLRAKIYFKEVNFNGLEPRLEISLSTVSEGAQRHDFHSKVISKIYKILSDHGADMRKISKKNDYTFFSRKITGDHETVYIPGSVFRTLDVSFLDEIADELAMIR